MGLTIFCLNLSHCLDLVSVPLCVHVCECASEYVRVSVCVCVTDMYMNTGVGVCGRARVSISETAWFDSLG